MRDRFVEADGRLEPVLQTGVPAEIVLREWLLDHEQPVGVEIREMLRVTEGIGAVGVGHQRRVRTERLAHRPDVLDVSPRPDLDLAIPARQRVASLVDQRRGLSWMAMEMPVAIARRVPPSSRDRLLPSRSAHSAQAPISTAAFAIGWPRKLRRSMASTASGWPIPTPSTRGAIHSVSASHVAELPSDGAGEAAGTPALDGRTHTLHHDRAAQPENGTMKRIEKLTRPAGDRRKRMD